MPDATVWVDQLYTVTPATGMVHCYEPSTGELIHSYFDINVYEGVPVKKQRTRKRDEPMMAVLAEEVFREGGLE